MNIEKPSVYSNCVQCGKALGLEPFISFYMPGNNLFERILPLFLNESPREKIIQHAICPDCFFKTVVFPLYKDIGLIAEKVIAEEVAKKV